MYFKDNGLNCIAETTSSANIQFLQSVLSVQSCVVQKNGAVLK